MAEQTVRKMPVVMADTSGLACGANEIQSLRLAYSGRSVLVSKDVC